MSAQVAVLRTRPETVVEDYGRLMRLGSERGLGVADARPFASGVHHDMLRYPTVGRARIRAFAATPWGRLFERY